ncbi:MAG: hypothetical protein WCB93_11245 [Gallionella sp.]
MFTGVACISPVESCRWFAADGRNARKMNCRKTNLHEKLIGRLIFCFPGGLYLDESYENDQRAVNAIRDLQVTCAGRIESRDIPHLGSPHRDMMAACKILTTIRCTP